MDYFTSQKISPSITRIKDVTGVLMYLAEGDKKAILIDTGTGLGSLKEYVKSLTSLPLTVILTHGHADHGGGAALFETVYLNEADFELVRHHCTYDVKSKYAEFIMGTLPPVEVFAPDRGTGYTLCQTGDIFDLGGISLQVIALPGHTHGMMTILFREERSILLGDACNSSLFLFLEESLTVEQYKKSLQRFQDQYGGLFDKVYLSHGTGDIPKQVIQDCLDVCEDILAGRADAVPFVFMKEEQLIAKKINGNQERLDGKWGNIVYNKNKIR
ncbi:MBL fold metallo-hydrolase [Spirochaetia bacterium]|nr:MBL fold metallo-hydrolase [Spirochaetia bacterium]